MGQIRDAMNQLPSWPGFAIGAVLIIGIGGWYYGTSYVKCAEVRDSRETLRAAIERAAGSDTGILTLSEIVPGDWDETRIVQAHNPGQVPLNCPFGWDMTWRERQALVEAGKYTIIGFFRSGQFDRYIEYRGDWATFADPPKSIARAEASFAIGKPSAAGAPYTLTLVR